MEGRSTLYDVSRHGGINQRKQGKEFLHRMDNIWVVQRRWRRQNRSKTPAWLCDLRRCKLRYSFGRYCDWARWAEFIEVACPDWAHTALSQRGVNQSEINSKSLRSLAHSFAASIYSTAAWNVNFIWLARMVYYPLYRWSLHQWLEVIGPGKFLDNCCSTSDVYTYTIFSLRFRNPWHSREWIQCRWGYRQSGGLMHCVSCIWSTTPP